MKPSNSGENTSLPPGTLEAVRRSLDDLATTALTAAYRNPADLGTNGGPSSVPHADSEPAEMLAALSRIAEQAGASGVAEATELAQTLRAEPPGTHEELLEAIACLERALENAGPTVSPALERNAIVAEATAAEPAPPHVAISADPELLNDFILESRDHLAAIEANLLTIEQEPANTEAIHAVFRGFHTIKGLAGFLELPAMQQAAHEIETLLDHARNGKLTLRSALIDVVLEGADYIRTDVDRVAETLAGAAASPTAPNSELIAKVRRAMAAALGNKLATGQVEAGSPPPELPRSAPTSTPETAAPDAMSDWPAAPGPHNNGRANQSQPSQIPNNQMPNNHAEPSAEPARPADNSGDQRGGAESARLVKVATGKLDFLVDMIGELVIAQSMIHHDSALGAVKSATLQRNLAQLGRITADVQKTAMSMRMVPVGQLFQKSARMIRDLTRRSGKLAELEMTGEETQLDRTIVEELADPLLHMIRNSADHGIETPAERTACGKPATARIGLKAYHRAGHIAIEVSDDGRGLPREKILAKALQKGLVAPGAELSDKEVFNLIFEPGFSTADQVTNVSGRGVGMDVVRKQMQKLRGRIDIESRPGQGTTFILKLPLTLAIIDGLVVGVGEERYILPIYAVEEMFRPAAEAIFTVENRREMVLIRGGLLPVVRLHRRFSIATQARDLTDGVLVVAESGEKKFCLAVDQLLGKQEVVIKNLGEMFKRIPGVAGGAILGDGRVGLILDMDGLFQEAHA